MIEKTILAIILTYSIEGEGGKANSSFASPSTKADAQRYIFSAPDTLSFSAVRVAAEPDPLDKDRDRAWSFSKRSRSSFQARSRSLTEAPSSISIGIFVQRIGLCCCCCRRFPLLRPRGVSPADVFALSGFNALRVPFLCSWLLLRRLSSSYSVFVCLRRFCPVLPFAFPPSRPFSSCRAARSLDDAKNATLAGTRRGDRGEKEDELEEQFGHPQIMN
jgi:hypothetical protein